MSVFYERRLAPFDTFQSENLNFFPHTHGHVELVSAKEGLISLTVGEHAQVLAPGDMAIVFPNIIHSYTTERHSVARLLIFDTELVREYAHSLSRYQPAHPFLGKCRVHPDALYALGALERDGSMPPELLKGYLLVLVGRVLESLALERRPALADEDLLSRLLIYLDEHFKQDINLDGIGMELGASRYQISRCFTHRIGCNFNSYVNALRASCAANLLRQSELSVAEAGYEAGFDSLSTFYRAFKTSYAQSPKAYRDQLKGGAPL